LRITRERYDESAECWCSAGEWEDIMKTRYTVALSMIAGAALGGAAIQGLHAQAKPPAYLVIEINKITDAEGFKALTQRPRGGADAAKELGGHYIARTDKITALDGTAPERFAVYAFESVEKAQAFNNSSYMKEVNSIREKTTQARSFIVEGMPH
jgi:uncharacterized protein (DUF1330 family)